MARWRYLVPRGNTSKPSPNTPYLCPCRRPNTHPLPTCTFWPNTALLGLFSEHFSETVLKNTKSVSETLLWCGNSEPFRLELCAMHFFRAQMLTPHACLATVLHPQYTPPTYGIASLVQIQLGVSGSCSKTCQKSDQFLKKKLSKTIIKLIILRRRLTLDL